MWNRVEECIFPTFPCCSKMEDIMAIFINHEEIIFQDHPMFQGVKIAKLAGKQDGSPIGVSLLRIGQGVEIPVHTHESSVDSVYCTRGSGEMFHDGSWSRIEKGGYCLVPAGEEHGVRNTGDQSMELFIVHCPPLF